MLCYGLCLFHVLVTAMRLLALLLVAFWFISSPNMPPPAEVEASFATDADDFIAEAMATLGVIPGVSVAVVREGQPIYLRGFGMADVDAGLPVTPNTLFYIASSTKSFVGLTAALLDARGELDLDAPITQYLSKEAFPANVQADRVTVRDLLTHTAGLENNPIVFRTAYSGEHTPDVLHALLSETTVNETAPHGTFAYTNLGYNLLGLILEEQTGKPWQDLVQEEVLAPLAMTRTTAYASLPEQQGWPQARPHFAFGTDGPELLALQKQDNTMHAAGGMMSSATDLAQWLIMNLQDGRVGDQEMLPAAVIQETHRKQAEVDAEFFRFHRNGYGLGWYHAAYGEETLVHQFGSFAGFRAHVSFMPEHNLGVAVLVNESTLGNTFADVVATFLYDWWLVGPEAKSMYEGFVQRLVQQRDQFRQRIESDRAERATRTFTLTAPLSAYTGTYVHPAGGTLRISKESQTLVVQLGNLRAVATPFTAPNTIRVELIPLQGEVIGFEVTDTGAVPRLQYNKMRFERE